MSFRLSKGAATRIADTVRKVDSLPDNITSHDFAPSSATDQDTFCYAFVVDATGPVIASGSEYDLTKPVLCNRVVEVGHGSTLRLDTSGFDSIDIDIDVGESGTITVNSTSDTNETLTAKLEGAGAVGAQGRIHGKFIYISTPSDTNISPQPNLAVLSRGSEWVLDEPEEFFLSKVPSKDLQPGDLVEIHFSQSQGGVIVPQEVTTVEDDCCTNRVINNTDLQLDIPTYQGGEATGNTRTINTTSTWVAELKRDLTVEIDGGFVRLVAGDYAMTWVPASESWARPLDTELIFMTTSGVVIGTDLTATQNVAVNAAYLEMETDDGTGNVSLSLVVDATVTTV